MKVKHVAKETTDGSYVIRDKEGKLVAVYCDKVLLVEDLYFSVDTLEKAMELVGELA